MLLSRAPVHPFHLLHDPPLPWYIRGVIVVERLSGVLPKTKLLYYVSTSLSFTFQSFSFFHNFIVCFFKSILSLVLAIHDS